MTHPSDLSLKQIAWLREHMPAFREAQDASLRARAESDAAQRKLLNEESPTIPDPSQTVARA